jgi:hypothetical protein
VARIHEVLIDRALQHLYERREDPRVFTGRSG